MSRERVRPAAKGYTPPKVHREHRQASSWARRQALQQMFTQDHQARQKRIVRIRERLLPFLGRRRRKRQAKLAGKALAEQQAALAQQVASVELARERHMRRAGMLPRRDARRLFAAANRDRLPPLTMAQASRIPLPALMAMAEQREPAAA